MHPIRIFSRLSKAIFSPFQEVGDLSGRIIRKRNRLPHLGKYGKRWRGKGWRFFLPIVKTREAEKEENPHGTEKLPL